MTTSSAPTTTAAIQNDSDLLLNHRLYGRGRVPGERARQRAQTFDVTAFTHALEHDDVNDQLDYDALDADTVDAEARNADLDHPPVGPRTVKSQSITQQSVVHTWLEDADVRDLAPHVTHLLEGGVRVTFTERWDYDDGTQIQGTSTTDIHERLITTEHTMLVWDAPQ